MINYNTSEVVLRLSDSKDSLLVMKSTEVRSAKDETATEDGGVDDTGVYSSRKPSGWGPEPLG